MGRIRTIKPEFWEDEAIGLLSRDARLLFLCCLNSADDEGILRWSGAYLKAQAFIYDSDLTVKTVEKLMKELTESSLIFSYTASKAKQPFGLIVNFHKHQKINRPTPSRLPPPPIQDYRVKQMYANRDGWTCHLCGGAITREGVDAFGGDFDLTLDHVVPESHSGSDYPSNLRCAHQTCNKGRCNRSVEEYRKLIKEGKTSAQFRWKEQHPAPLSEDSMSGSREEGKGNGRDKEKDQGDLGLSPLSAEPTDGLEKGADDLPKIRPEEFGNVWNRRRGTLPKIETFTESRRKKVLTRMRQGLTLERFTEAVENCRVKPFLCGENDRGWTATFDWLVENDKNVEKAINNPYGGGNGARIPTGKGIENLGVSQRLIDRIERDRAAQQNGHLPAGEGGPSDTPALRGSAEGSRSEGLSGGDVERFPF